MRIVFALQAFKFWMKNFRILHFYKFQSMILDYFNGTPSLNVPLLDARSQPQPLPQPLKTARSAWCLTTPYLRSKPQDLPRRSWRTGGTAACQSQTAPRIPKIPENPSVSSRCAGTKWSPKEPLHCLRSKEERTGPTDIGLVRSWGCFSGF